MAVVSVLFCVGVRACVRACVFPCLDQQPTEHIVLQVAVCVCLCLCVCMCVWVRVRTCAVVTD